MRDVTFTETFSTDGEQEFSKFWRIFERAMNTTNPKQRGLYLLKAIGDDEREARIGAEKAHKEQAGTQDLIIEQIGMWMRRKYRLRLERHVHMAQLNTNYRRKPRIQTWIIDLKRSVRELKEDHQVVYEAEDQLTSPICQCSRRHANLEALSYDIDKSPVGQHACTITCA